MMVSPFKKSLLMVCLSVCLSTYTQAQNHAEIASQTSLDATLSAKATNIKESNVYYGIDLSSSIFLSNIYPIAFSIENKSNKKLKFSTKRIGIKGATLLTRKELSSQISSESGTALLMTIILFPIGLMCAYKLGKLQELEPIIDQFSPSDDEITIDPHTTFTGTLFVQVEPQKNAEGKIESYTPADFQITIPIKDGDAWNIPLFTKDPSVFNLRVSNTINLVA